MPFALRHRAALALALAAAAPAIPAQVRVIPDAVGVLNVPTTHWINTSQGVRLCLDREGFFAGTLGSEQKRVESCSRPLTLTQYVQAKAGRAAYPTDIDRLAQGQLTVEYVLITTARR